MRRDAVIKVKGRLSGFLMRFAPFVTAQATKIFDDRGVAKRKET